MKKSFLLPLVVAIVAAGGTLATAGSGAQDEAYGSVGGQCMPGELVDPENCSAAVTSQRCEVTIGGLTWPAYSDENCENEIFRQPDNR